MCRACTTRIVDDAIEEGIVRYEARDSTIWLVENAPEFAATELTRRRYEEKTERAAIADFLGIPVEQVAV